MNAGRLNILLVEDNEDDYIIVRDLLQDIDPQKFTLEWVSSYEEGLQAVQAGSHDLILLDFRLSYHTGLELLQETQSISKRAPVIFMTGQGDYETDVQAMQSGATDYLVKDRLDADLLERAIRYAVERQKSAETLRASEDRYRAFIGNSTEGIWRFEVEPPLSIDWPENEQIAHLCRFAKIAECNDAVARIYGFACAANVIGAPLGDFLSLDAVGQGECLTEFVGSHYLPVKCDAFDPDQQGRPKYISHTLTGVVENGFLQRVWGTLSDITERKSAELAQAQLVAIVETSSDAIISTTLDGLIVTWNKGAEETYGYTEQEVTGQLVSCVMPEDHIEEMGSSLECIRRGERVVAFDTVRLHKDGRRFDVSLSVSPLRDAAGQVNGTSSISRDISAEKHAERMIQTSEVNLAMAQRIAHFGSWELELGNKDTLSANPLHCSDETFRIFGYELSNAPVTTELFFQVVPPEDQQAIQQAIAAAIAQRQGYSLIHRVQRPDGEVRIVRETVQFFEEEATGQCSRLVGTVHDITEQQQAAEVLQTSEREQRKLAEQLQIERARLVEAQAIAKTGSWETDLSTIAVTWSAETYRIFEIAPEQFPITHERFLQSVHPEDRAAVDNALIQSLKQSGSCAIEHRLLLPDGRIKFVEECWRAFQDDAGRPVRALGTCQDITERRQADALLTGSQERLALATESAQIGIWDWDIVSNKMLWDTQMYALYGIREQDFTGAYSAWQHGLHPEDRERSEAEINDALDGSRDFHTQFRVVWPSGEVRHIEAHALVQRANNGFALRMTGVNWDITERKQAEEALRESGQRLRALFDSTLDAILIADDAGRYLDANPAACELLGIPHSRLVGMAVTDFVVPMPGQQSWQSFIAEGFQEGEIEMLCAGDVPRRVEYRARTNFLPGQHLSVLRDITDRKSAEEERDRFFTLSLDMLAIIGNDGYIKRLNPAFEAILGWSDAELMSKPFLEFVHPDDISATLAEMANLNSGLKTIRFENRYICRDGSYKWLRWMSTPHEDLWYSAAHDITAIKQAEAALLQTNDELEARVEERTQALQSAMEEAEWANAAKSEFLSRMSHELRTPMNSILGFAQIMEMDAPSEKQAIRLGHIIHSGQHLLKLINEVLDTARIESGRFELSTEPVSLSSALRTATEMIQPLCGPRNQRLVCDWADWESFYVRADQQRLSQVFINLLSNATKFNRDGGVILVNCEQGAEGRLRVSISDSGLGIPADKIVKLFQPFERLDAEGGPIEGTGLGLALSKRLMELMDGTIGVNSVVGTGSTFWVELPQAEGPLQTIKALPPLSFPLLGGSYTILCIEDNSANLQVIEHILSNRLQYQLLSAATGLEGLQIAHSERPSLILLDLHLPDLPGSEVLSRLQNDSITRDIPVVIVSADATVSQIRRLRAAGAAEFLTKPLDVQLFLDVLQDILHKQNALVK